MRYSANPQALTRSQRGVATLAWPRWTAAVVIVGALLTATGAVLALLPSSEHLNTAGRNYADYFATRNFAIAALLLVLLAARARPVLAVVMVLTASIQLLDAISASLTGRAGLIPIDLAYAAAFMLGAARLQGMSRWSPTRAGSARASRLGRGRAPRRS